MRLIYIHTLITRIVFLHGLLIVVTTQRINSIIPRTFASDNDSWVCSSYITEFAGTRCVAPFTVYLYLYLFYHKCRRRNRRSNIVNLGNHKSFDANRVWFSFFNSLISDWLLGVAVMKIQMILLDLCKHSIVLSSINVRTWS